MAPRSDWLVFDLGGVVVDVAAPPVTLNRLARVSDTPVERLKPLLRERFGAGPWSAAERLQVGELDLEMFQAELNAVMHRPIDREALVQAMQAMLLGVKHDTEVLLTRLAGRYRLACFSNTNAVHWRHMQAQFGFFEYFRYAFASHELGHAKPDPAGYAAVSATLQADPAKCLLIDDRSINVDGARHAGWQALRFESASQLAAALEARGIATGAGA